LETEKGRVGNENSVFPVHPVVKFKKPGDLTEKVSGRVAE
jgi:hypothetical protein